MSGAFRATAGAAGWQVSNPPVLSAAPLLASLEIFAAAGIEQLARQVAATHVPSCSRRSSRAAAATSRSSARRSAPARRQLSVRVRGGSDTRPRGVRGARARGRCRRLARARHHPHGAGAAVQQLRGRLARRRSPPPRESDRRCLSAVQLSAAAGVASPSSAPGPWERCWPSCWRSAAGAVQLLERRADPRGSAARARPLDQPRARRARPRGARARRRAGARAAAADPDARPQVHDLAGDGPLLPYGQRADEVIYSVSRERLNRVLIEAAAELPAIELQLRAAPWSTSIRPARRLHWRERPAAPYAQRRLGPLIGTDGAGSGAAPRRCSGATLLQVARGAARPRLQGAADSRAPGDGTLAARAARAARLAARRLHADRAAQPRRQLHGDAVPAARAAPASFASLGHAGGGARAFSRREFPDALALHAGLRTEFAAASAGPARHRARRWPWRAPGSAATRRCRARHRAVSWPGHECGIRGLRAARWAARTATPTSTRAAARFERRRRPDTDAIATDGARELQGDARQRCWRRTSRPARQLALDLERRFPRRFIPRYSMVMFHPEIPYAEALRRGAIQARMLEALLRRGASADAERAAQLVTERLRPA